MRDPELLGYSVPAMSGERVTFALRTDFGFAKLSARRKILVEMAHAILAVTSESTAPIRKTRKVYPLPIYGKSLTKYRKVMRSWKAGGITQWEACRLHHANYPTFRSWLDRERKIARANAVGKVA
jgi:hypothetical protein